MAITAASTAVTIELRVPVRSCDSTSWPSSVVPSKWPPDGPCMTAAVLSEGSCGDSKGPKMASRTNTPMITRPITALRVRSALMAVHLR